MLFTMGLDMEQVTSGSDPGWVFQGRTLLSFLPPSPHCDFEDTLGFSSLMLLNTNVSPDQGWPNAALETGKYHNNFFFSYGTTFKKNPKQPLKRCCDQWDWQTGARDIPPIPGTTRMEPWVPAPALNRSGTGAPETAGDPFQSAMKSRGFS